MHGLGRGQELVTTSWGPLPELQLPTLSLGLVGSSGSPFQPFVWNTGVHMPCCVVCLRNWARVQGPCPGPSGRRSEGHSPPGGEDDFLPGSQSYLGARTAILATAGGPAFCSSSLNWSLPGTVLRAGQCHLGIGAEGLTRSGFGVSYTSGLLPNLPAALYSPGPSWLLWVFCSVVQAAVSGSRGVGVLTQSFTWNQTLVHVGICVNRDVYTV